MATPPDEVRAGLALATTAATSELVAAMADAAPEQTLSALTEVLPLVVPSWYDAAGSLAVAWYDELRSESSPAVPFDPMIVSDPNADWIERELRDLQQEMEREAERLERDIARDIEAESARIVAEAEALVQKEVARGFRDTIDGNSRRDPESVGWSRHARPEACRFCLMLARDSAVYRREQSARFAAHTDCGCVARPEFANGEHGPEANVYQYLASKRKRTAAEKKALRQYLNDKYPDAPG